MNFFGQIANDNSSILYQISLRQLALKNLPSASLLMGVIRLCFKYNLPSPHSIILDPQPMDKWKTTVKKSVSVYWNEKLQLEASSKSTLGLLSITNNENLRKASCLVPLNTNAVAKHRLQMRLLSGTFTFQSERARFYGEDPTCTLCGMQRKMQLIVSQIVRPCHTSETRI